MKSVTTKVTLILCFLLMYACNCDNWILYRATSEYFPLSVGNRWVYKKGDELRFVEVCSETIIGGYSAFVIRNNFQDEFWKINEGRIEKLIQRYIIIAGNEYLLKRRWGIRYQIPLIWGNHWNDYERDSINVLGQNYSFEYVANWQIVGCEDVITPAGSFIESYRLDFFEEITINGEHEIYQGSEWLAPNVGLVKRVINGQEELLIDYTIVNK
ncbi:MAG: hypothetical protein ABIK10_01385 [candidate division WOR-3 bacterium]